MMAATLKRFLPVSLDTLTLEPLVRPTLHNWNGVAVGAIRPTALLTA
jgi:hypothetical protein